MRLTLILTLVFLVPVEHEDETVDMAKLSQSVVMEQVVNQLPSDDYWVKLTNKKLQFLPRIISPWNLAGIMEHSEPVDTLDWSKCDFPVLALVKLKDGKTQRLVVNPYNYSFAILKGSKPIEKCQQFAMTPKQRKELRIYRNWFSFGDSKGFKVVRYQNTRLRKVGFFGENNKMENVLVRRYNAKGKYVTSEYYHHNDLVRKVSR